MICPKCNHDISEGMKFCPSCGCPIPQKRYCPHCGCENVAEALYCRECGKLLKELDSTQLPYSRDNQKIHANTISKEMTSNKKTGGSIGVIATIITVCFIGLFVFYNSQSNTGSSTENSTEELQESDESQSNDNEYMQKKLGYLKSYNRAKSELADISLSCSPIMEQYANISGSWSMAYLVASRNNPTLFSHFEDAYDNYVRCAQDLIELCESNGESDEASIYRNQLNKTRTLYKRIKGMP